MTEVLIITTLKGLFIIQIYGAIAFTIQTETGTPTNLHLFQNSGESPIKNIQWNNTTYVGLTGTCLQCRYFFCCMCLTASYAKVSFIPEKKYTKRICG